MIYFGSRASSIIYNFIMSNASNGYYLLPVNICPIVPFIFIKARIEFKFIDIQDDNLSIDQIKALSYTNDKNCIGLVYVYTYGIEKSVNSFFKMLKNNNKKFIIIEDKCLCKPSFNFEDKSEYSDIAVYSTGYAKFLDLNYGGFGVSDNNIQYSVHPTIYSKNDLQKTINSYKWSLENEVKLKQYYNDWLDNNDFKKDIIKYKEEVTIGLTEMIEHKLKINSVYINNLPKEIQIQSIENNIPTWRFNIRVNKKEELLKKIFSLGLFASSHYQRVDKVFKNTFIEAPKAELLHKEVVNLFNDKYYTIEMAKKTCDLINKHLQNYN